MISRVELLKTGLEAYNYFNELPLYARIAVVSVAVLGAATSYALYSSRPVSHLSQNK